MGEVKQANEAPRAETHVPTGASEKAPNSSSAPLCLVACLLLALAQVLWAGYQVGVGNQSIQIPFLKKIVNPSLYPRDVMVNETMGHYPSFFFRMLAWFVPSGNFVSLYFWLHLLTAFGVLAASSALAQAIFHDRWVALITALLLFGGQHRALAGDTLYSTGFTHTWAVFPLAILSLVLFYRDRHFPAFALAGALFNLHALTGGYLGLILGFWAVCEFRSLGWKRSLGLLLLFAAVATPTLVSLAAHWQSFGDDWLRLARIRSSQQLFASSWWQVGNPDIPRYLLLVGLGVLSLSFVPPSPQRRKTLLVAAAVGLMFIAGFVFAEVFPFPPALRAQLFRVSRLFLIVVLVHIANGIVQGWRAAFQSSSQSPEDRSHPWPRVAAWLEFAGASFVFLPVALPPLLPMLPLAFGVATLVALASGRLSWVQALAAGAVMVVCAAAWRSIEFPLFGTAECPPSGFAWQNAGPLLPVALLGAFVVWATQYSRMAWVRRLTGTAGTTLFLGIAVGARGVWLDTAAKDTQWVAMQEWVREHTPVDAVFLTPTQPGGFRIFSERSVVCEWRDGTQAFFNPRFGNEWFERMTMLRPGMLYDSRGKRLLARGKSLGELSDTELARLAEKFNATHIVLPAGGHRALEEIYRNSEWAIYLAHLPAPEPPKEVADKERWEAQEKFMREVVLPNIEKYRKSDARLQIVDQSGRPVYDMPFEIRQIKHAFAFSCSLPFFIMPEGPSFGDAKPPPVTEVELSRFLEIFNASLIPYSGKWMYLEPAEGNRWYDDLDRYVEWCARHGIEMEFHFISGYLPGWLRRKSGEEQSRLFLEHARDLIRRYGDRIRYWQVVNENHLLQYSPAVFQEIRALAPHLKLGISHCSKFYSFELPPHRERDMLRGIDEVRWLKTKGVQLDFFGFHGHRPFGVWFGPRDMYWALDEFAKEGVKLHVTEFALPLRGEILGNVRRGRWTPELQAEFYEYFFTICFSHPAVELINLWSIGPVSWQPDSGLLNRDFDPKPAFHALRELIKNRWHTRLSGKLGLDGVVAFRGFHGDYEIVLQLPNGETVRGVFSVKADDANQIRLRLDREKRSLESLTQ